MGVFQIESRAQMQSLYRTRPGDPGRPHGPGHDVRPGPILGGAVNPYIKHRQRMREEPDYVVPYDHPSLEPVLRDTLGTIIFQDQVIEVAMAFAGFSPGEAEGLRRAMSRKRSAAAIEAYHQRLPRRRGGHPRCRRGDRRAGLHDDRRLLGLRLPEGARGRLRPARLPVDLAARALRSRVPVRAAERAADGLLRAGHAGARGPAARDRTRAAGRERQRGRVHGRGGPPAGARADRSRLRPRRPQRRGRGAGRGPPRARPVPLARRPRLACRRRPPGAGEARVGGSVRRAPPGRRLRRRTALWQLGVAAPGERVNDGTQLSLPLEVAGGPRPCGRWRRGRGWWPTTRPPA